MIHIYVTERQRYREKKDRETGRKKDRETETGRQRDREAETERQI